MGDCDMLAGSSELPEMTHAYLSRRLAKETADCPQCGKTMRISTLAWSHKCKMSHPPSEAVVRARLAKMREMAVQSFQQRMCSARPEVSGCAATQGVMAGAAETPGTNDCNMD